MKQAYKKFTDWFLVIFWLAVIFYFSSQPDLKSSLPSIWDTVFRKIAHLAEYFVLTYLFWRALKNYKLSVKLIITSAGVASLLYAVSDEWHQLFVLGRQGSAVDVLIDAAGILVAFILLSYYNKNR